MSENKTSNKTDVVVKVILVFAISLLSFGIGAFVGKSYGERQAKLAKLEPQNPDKSHGEAPAPGDHHESSSAAPEAPQGHDSASKSEDLSQEDLAKLAEEFVNDETNTEVAHGATTHEATTHGTATHGEKSPNETPVAHKAEAAHSTPKEEHTAPSPRKVAHAPSAEHRKPSSLPATVAQSSLNKYTIQVASFPTEDEAQKRTLDLKDKGFAAFYAPAEVAGQTWYRVNVGLYSTQKEASENKTALMEKAQIASAIIKKLQ